MNQKLEGSKTSQTVIVGGGRKTPIEYVRKEKRALTVPGGTEKTKDIRLRLEVIQVK